MKKNRLLSLVITLCKILKGFYIMLLIVVTFLFIHFQIKPETYNRILLNSSVIESQVNLGTKGNSFFYSVDKFSKAKGKIPDDKDVFKVSKLRKSTLYIQYLRSIAFIVLIFLSIKEFQNIIESLKSIESFRKSNVVSFKRIAKYLFIVFALNFYVFIGFEEGSFTAINISYTILILAVLSLIMAEVFKEGNQLMEENRLTI